MTDTSKKTVEQKICNPIINYVADGRGISGSGYGEIIDIARELVRQRDAMSTALAFLASRGSELSGDQIETMARNALQKDR
jgi:hypothetical protein